MTFQLKALAAAVLAAALPFAASANLLTNGDFESNAVVIGGSNYATVNAGDTAITGWTVTGASVDLIQNGFGAIQGISVDLAGSPGPGAVSQSFSVTSGTLYNLTFDYFRNGDGVVPLAITFGNQPTVFLDPNVVVAPKATASYNWLANYTGQASVSFAASTFGNNGPVIDNVSVTAVPEPETYAMMLAGLGALGFMARRRQAK